MVASAWFTVFIAEILAPERQPRRFPLRLRALIEHPDPAPPAHYARSRGYARCSARYECHERHSARCPGGARSIPCDALPCKALRAMKKQRTECFSRPFRGISHRTECFSRQKSHGMLLAPPGHCADSNQGIVARADCTRLATLDVEALLAFRAEPTPGSAEGLPASEHERECSLF